MTLRRIGFVTEPNASAGGGEGWSGFSGPAAAELKRPEPPLSLAARMRGLASMWAAE